MALHEIRQQSKWFQHDTYYYHHTLIYVETSKIIAWVSVVVRAKSVKVPNIPFVVGERV